MIYQQDKMMKTMMEKSNKTPKVNNSNLIILIILPRLRFLQNFLLFTSKATQLILLPTPSRDERAGWMDGNHETASGKFYLPTEKWEIAKKSESLTKGNVKIAGNSK